MKDFVKIIKKTWHDYKVYKVLIIAECLLLIYSVFQYARPLSYYSCGPETLIYDQGTYLESFPYSEEAGVYIDNSLGGGKITVSTPVTDLRAGSYEVILHVVSNENTNCYSVEPTNQVWEAVSGRQSTGVSVNTETTSFRFDTPVAMEDYSVDFIYQGNGYMYVSGMEIRELGAWKNILLLKILFFSLLINIVAALTLCGSRTEKLTCWGVLLLAIMSSFPVFTPFAIEGHDIGMHLNRIEALKEAMENGIFPLRVSTYWYDGYGYAASVFYGDLFLVLPSALRVLGFTVQDAYKCYIVAVNAAAAGIGFYAFYKMLGSRKAAFAAAVLYVLAPYRLICIYTRAAVGEYTAMTFLPLIAWGLYRIFKSEDQDRKQDGRVILPAILGYSCVLECHLLSTVISAFFTFLICFIFIRKTLRKRTFIRLVKTVIYSALLNLWFLLPLLDYMRDKHIVTSSTYPGRFDAHGVFLADLFSLFTNGSSRMWTIPEQRIQSAEEAPMATVTIGAGLLAALLIYGILRLVKKDKTKASRLGDLCLGLGALGLWMCTYNFPWDVIQHYSSVLANVTMQIQFPFRFLGAVDLFLAICGGCAVVLLADEGDLKIHSWYRAGVLVMLIGAIAVSSVFIMEDLDRLPVTTYTDEHDLYSGNAGQQEYLPYDTDINMFGNHEVSCAEGVITQNPEQDAETIRFDYSTSGADEPYADVPRLYYRGYHAYDTDTGEEYFVTQGEGMRVRVMLPANASGRITVKWEEPWYWRVSEILSLLTVIFIAANVVLKHRGKRRIAG